MNGPIRGDMYESVRLTGSTYARCEIECPVHVGVFGRCVSLLQTAESGYGWTYIRRRVYVSTLKQVQS